MLPVNVDMFTTLLQKILRTNPTGMGVPYEPLTFCVARTNATLLFAVLGVAIFQNLLSGCDPQLAILYTLIVLTRVLIGGGRFSLDAWLEHRCKQNAQN